MSLKTVCLDFIIDDNVKKILRFAIDYCRASPNINFKNKTISNIGWRGSKYNIFVEFEMYNKEGQKLIVNIFNIRKNLY